MEKNGIIQQKAGERMTMARKKPSQVWRLLGKALEKTNNNVILAPAKGLVYDHTRH